MNDICKTNLSIYAFIAVETLYLEGRSDLIMMQNSWWSTNAIKYFNEIGKITRFIKKFSSLLTSNRKGTTQDMFYEQLLDSVFCQTMMPH